MFPVPRAFFALMILVTSPVLAIAGERDAAPVQLAANQENAPLKSITLTPRQINLTAIDLTYEVYGGGLHVVTFETQAVLTPTRYDIASRMETRGMLDAMVDGRVVSHARGLLTPDGPQFESFVQNAQGRFGIRFVQIAKEPDGNFLVVAEPREKNPSSPVPRSSLRGAIDPLSASIAATLREADNPCEGRLPIFDGRRRYDLTFALEDREVLAPSDKSGFAGETYRCKVEYRSIGGFTRQWQIAEAKNPSPPSTVWVARFPHPADQTGQRNIFLPVRMLVETNYINAMIHLAHAQIDGDVLVKTAALAD